MSPEYEKILAERLRREASQSRPPFSEALHTRVLEAIQNLPADARPVGRRGRNRRLARALIVAVSAACVIAAAALGWRALRPSPQREGNPRQVVARAGAAQTPTTIDTPDTVAADIEMCTDLADQATDKIGGLVDSVAIDQQLAYLDEDARLAAQALTNRLPLDAPEPER